MSTQFTDARDGKRTTQPAPAGFLRGWRTLSLLPVAALAYVAGTLTASGSQDAPQTTTPNDSAAMAKPCSGSDTARTEHATPADDEAEAAVAAPPVDSEDASDEGFTVQVAAYQDLGDAEQYAANLTERGLRAHLAEAPDGSRWHSVRLGPFDSRAKAEGARFQLKVHERKAAFVEPRSNGKYHVQVGSFQTREKAEPVAARFSAAGHNTKITRVKMGEEYWHCVRIGPFDTEEEADTYRELIGDLPGEAVVIPYGPPKP